MSRTLGQWFRFTVACGVVGFMVLTMYASLGMTKGQTRNEVRMGVDHTVLPVVLPDGTEAPLVAKDPAAITGETTLPQETATPPTPQPSQAVAKETPPTTVPIPPKPKPESTPAPTPKPAPEPKPEPIAALSGQGTITSISLSENTGSFTLTIQANKAVGDTTYMNLTSPRRLVIDLRDKWNYRSKNVIRSKGVVKHLVVGEHKDRLRLVIHFNTPPKAKLQPQFKRTGTALNVTVPIP